MPNAVLIDVVRTGSGRGKPGGALCDAHPTDLLATVLTALVERSSIDPALVDDVIAGCVIQARDQAGNIARNAALSAGFPASVPGVTVDRQCGSSQQAVQFAAQGVMAGGYQMVIAAGVESMSRVPMGTSRMGASQFGGMAAALFPDGFVNQGVSAELVAQRWALSRSQLDEYSARSHERAAAAARAGQFDREIVPVFRPGQAEHLVDETIRGGTSATDLAALAPAFATDELERQFPDLDWKVTAGSSSPMTDGASAALITSEEVARALGLTPRARFVSFAAVGSDPILMLTGPIAASQLALERSGLTIDDMAAYEVNEAFASVPLMWAAELHADPERLNPRGGAIALGHALGSSGTRLLATMLNHLEQTDGRYGLQTMCEGGGMANALILECR